jgi:hypothetical protein
VKYADTKNTNTLRQQIGRVAADEQVGKNIADKNYAITAICNLTIWSVRL